MRKKCITALILLAKIFEVLLLGYDDSSKRTDFGKHLQSTKKSRTTIIIIRSSFKEQKFCKDCLKSMVGQITSFNVSSFVSKFKFLTNKVVPSSFSESPSSSSSLSATACSSLCHKTKKLLITASLYNDTKHRRVLPPQRISRSLFRSRNTKIKKKWLTVSFLTFLSLSVSSELFFSGLLENTSSGAHSRYSGVCLNCMNREKERGCEREYLNKFSRFLGSFFSKQCLVIRARIEKRWTREMPLQ